MRIQGTVENGDGRLLGCCRIDAKDATRKVVATGLSGNDGQFFLEGPGIINIEVFPPGWEGPATSVHYLPFVHRITGTPRPEDVEINVRLEKATRVPLTVYDEQGVLLTYPTDTQKQLNVNQFHFFDLEELPATGRIHWSEQDERPYILIPENQPRILSVLWTAPGYGRVVCLANNKGRGYVGSEGETRGIFLNIELAKTAWNRLQEELADCQRGGYELSNEITSGVERLTEMISEIDGAETEKERAKSADKALGLCLSVGEKLVVERAKQRIKRQRNKQRVVNLSNLINCGDKPISGASVKYRQLTHDFRFGVFVNPSAHPIQRVPLNGSPLWEELENMGVNLLPMPLIWSRLEPKRGQRHDKQQYEIFPAKDLSEAGFKLKDHISVWFWQGAYPEQWGTFTPNWTYELAAEEIPEAVYKHMSTVTKRYAPFVKDWQAINEPMLSHTNCLNLDLDKTAQVVESAIRAIRDNVEDAVVEVNSCQVFGEEIHPDVQAQGYEMVPDRFYESLLERGVQFDTTGMQLYYGGYMDSHLFSGGFPIRHPWDLEKIIKRYARLGKPIRITEVSVPSSFPKKDQGLDFGYWHGPWNLQRQAEWTELLYTLCYSLPQVAEITWWNATDEGAFIKDGGLLYEDYTRKPVAHTLSRLTSQWKVEGESKVAENGTVTIPGPAGRYEFVVERNHEVLGKVVLDLV